MTKTTKKTTSKKTAKKSSSAAKSTPSKSDSDSTAKAKTKADTIQPEVSIGFVGHVDHGKTTLTQRLSGKWTDTHSEELKRGITIRLGYADIDVYQDTKTEKYLTSSDDLSSAKHVRRISLVDAPGHESLMATMLSGAAIMDGAILLVAANERCPQPQTVEHLTALQVAGIRNVIVVQNKIDLVNEERAMKNFTQIKEFLEKTPFKDAPVIPISAFHGANIDTLLAAIEEHIPTPTRDEKASAQMLIARSFDINKPGSKPSAIKGGVLGGSLTQGSISVGDEIEIRPGRREMKKNKIVSTPITTTVTGVMSAGKPVDRIGPGGSVALMTSLDPAIVAGDRMSGHVVGPVGKLPPIWSEIRLEVTLLERFVDGKDELVVRPLANRETLMLNVNSAATVGIVEELKKNTAILRLKLPICAAIGQHVAISRNLGNRWRLIGYGTILEHKQQE